MKSKTKDKLLIIWAEFGCLVLTILLILDTYFNKFYWFQTAFFFGLVLINFVLVRRYFRKSLPLFLNHPKKYEH